MTLVKRISWIHFAAFTFVLLVLLSELPSLVSAGQVDDDVCLACHEGQDKTLEATPHRLRSLTKSASSDVACQSCHDGAEVHIEDPSADNITNPAHQDGYDAVKTCSSCHQSHVELDNYGFDAHNNQQINCASCHQVHGGKSSLLLDDRAEFCYPCHARVKDEFAKRSNHPVKQGIVTCLSCHKFTKREGMNIAYDLGRICQDCHPQQAGPYVFEHAPVNAYEVEGSGCLECHEPHASANDRLLKQKDNQLCNQCHVLPGHQIAHGTYYRDYSCLTCHPDTHGSFVSNRLLDPNLPSKLGDNCYQVGCHSLNR